MSSKEIKEVVLPKRILEDYELQWVEENEEEVKVHLDEKVKTPEVPMEHKGKGIRSKGLTRARKIEDFPIRGKRTFLVIRHRKWKITGVKELIIKEVDINYPETKLTKEYALFLKATGRKRASRT